MSTALRRYARLYRGYDLRLAVFVVGALFQVLVVAPLPFIIRHVFDTTLIEGDFGDLLGLALLLLALEILSGLFNILSSTSLISVSAEVVQHVREDVFDKLYSLPIRFHETNRAADTHDRVVQETERVDVMTRNGFAIAFPAIIFIAGIIVVLIFVNWLLLLVTIAFLPLVWWANRLTVATLRRAVNRLHQTIESFSDTTFGALRMMRQTRILGAEALARVEQDVVLQEAADAGKRHGFVRKVHTEGNRVVLATWMMGILIVGGAGVIENRLTLGELFSFYAGLALIRGPLMSIATSIPVIVGGGAALERVFALLDEDEPPPYCGTRQLDIDGRLVLDSVTFGYSGGSPVFESVSLSVNPGEVIALMGANGAGKTTITNLILGFYRPLAGSITIDGVAYDDLDMGSLRRQFGVLTQDPVLIAGTVRENVSWGRSGLSDADIVDLLALVSKRSLVDELDHGLDTKAFENGPLLSGGQTQRIAIARALAGWPRLLILDEPSNNLDAEAVETLLESLRNFPDAPSMIVITHEPKVAALADRVYRLSAGQISTDLPPDEL